MGRRQRKTLADLRLNWGKELERERDLEAIGLYHRSRAFEGPSVDEQTWQDLEMDAVFAKLDRTVSAPGRQLLYHQLRTYADGPALAERTRQQECFKADAAFRERVQLILAQLDLPKGEWLAAALLNPFPRIPSFAPLLYLSSLLSLFCLVGMVFNHTLLGPVLVLFLVNTGITSYYGRRILPEFTGFAQIVTLLSASAALARLENPHSLPQLAELRRTAPLGRGLRRKLGWLAADRSAMPGMMESLLGYLNMLFLFDILVYFRCLRALRGHQAELVGIFAAVGSLDAAIAAASFAAGCPVFVRPVLAEGRRIEVAGLYHPLLANPVPNSLKLEGRSALIAGPNMAGKTVFIRTVGINVLLAQTLHFCLAEQAALPRARIRSAIRREDILEAGQSYFFAEIRQLGEFVQAESGTLHLFLIDEIFRGTNTLERIAASAAVLRHLAQNHLVLTTTHDIELQQLLADAFDMCHFSDQVVDGRYGFDYRIHPGPARSRNAIKLLEISGYPPSIVREAEAALAREIAASPRPGPAA